MISFSTRSPMVYMTLGNPGAGKTFFARQFSQSIGVPLVHVDQLRFMLYDDPAFSADEDRTVAGLADYITEQFLKSGLSVVIDGLNHTRTRRHYLRQLARKHGAVPLVVWVQTNDDTCFDRATRRDRRNHDDKYARELEDDEYDVLVSKVKPPQNENYVVISGRHVYKNQLNVVSRKVMSLFVQPKVSTQPPSPTAPNTAAGEPRKIGSI